MIIFGATVLPWGVPHDIRGVQGRWRRTLTPTPPSALEPCRYTDRQAHCSAGNGAVNNNRIESNKTLWATRDLHSAARTPPEVQESVLQSTRFSFGVRASGHRFPCPGGTSFRDTAPRGIAGDCVAERKFRRGDLCSGPTKPYEPREPCIRWHAPPGLSGVRVTEYKFPPRGVQGRWRQTLTPAPPRPRDRTGTLAALRKGN